MFNKVILVGRLCFDPELKYTPSGIATVTFRIAVDRPFQNAQGEREADFIDIVAWRQLAETVNNYMGKGRLVLVDGRLQVRSWQTPDGQKRKTAEVVADNIRMLDKPREQRDASFTGGEPPPERNNNRGAAPAAAGGQRDEFTAPEQMPDFDMPDITDPFADQ